MISGPRGTEADHLHPQELADLERVVAATQRELVQRLEFVDNEFLSTDSEAREREQVLIEEQPVLQERAEEAATALEDFEESHRNRGVEWWRRPFPSWTRWCALPVVTIAEAMATYLLLEGLTSSTVTRTVVGLVIGAVLAFTGDQTGGELAEWWRGFRMFRLGVLNHPRPTRMLAALAGLMLVVGLGAGALRATGTVGPTQSETLADAGLAAEAAADSGAGLGDWAVYLLLGVVPALVGVGIALGAVNELADAHDDLVRKVSDAQRAIERNVHRLEGARRARQRAASAFLVEAEAWPTLRDSIESQGREHFYSQRAGETEFFGTSVSPAVIAEVDRHFERIRALEFPARDVAYALSVFNGDLGSDRPRPADPPDLSMVQ